MVEALVVAGGAIETAAAALEIMAGVKAVASVFGGNVEPTDDKLSQWLLTGSKMVWVSKKKKDCFKPYVFKKTHKVSTPFIGVGEYNWQVLNNTSFQITGWTNTWVYDLQKVKGPDGKQHYVPVCISSPLNAHNGVVMTDVF